MTHERLYTLREAERELERRQCAREHHAVQDNRTEIPYFVDGGQRQVDSHSGPLDRGAVYCRCGQYVWLPSIAADAGTPRER